MSYPYSSFYLESQWSKLKLAEEFRNALALLRDAIRPDGIAQSDHPWDSPQRHNAAKPQPKVRPRARARSA
jgi:hypothetical protein